MPRKRVVSRTLDSTIVTIIGVDVESKKTVEADYHLLGRVEDPVAALRKLRKLYETDVFKLSAVIKLTPGTRCRYVMTEEDFINAALCSEVTPPTKNKKTKTKNNTKTKKETKS